MNPLKSKWVTFTRTICPKTGIHYLDALDEHGRHWAAQMHYGPERWLTFIPDENWAPRTMSQPLETFTQP
jgi:hypothetical protein